MKNSKLYLFVALFLIFLELGCIQQAKTNSVRIEINGSKGQNILIASSNILNFKSDTLAFATTDSMGKAILNFDIPQTLWYSDNFSGL
jgi:hypothetical protein